MKITPLAGQVQVKFEEAKVGALDTSSRSTAVEIATVVAIGDGVSSFFEGATNIKAGDKVFVKAWAVDEIVYKDVKYHFVNFDSKGILAIVNDK